MLTTSKSGCLNGFKFSTSKTVCIHYHQQYGFYPDPNILLGKMSIKVAKEAKFLGLVFEKYHVQYLKSSCQKAVHILQVVRHTDWGADCIVLLCQCCALVCSILDDRCIVYRSAHRSILKQLDPIRSRACISRWGLFAHLLPKASTWRHVNRP